MRPTTAFTLDTADAERTGRSTLLFRNRRAGTVPASVIDAQLAVSGGFVVLLSYNDIFSALQTIPFVDPSGMVRDRLTLGGAMAQGLITDIRAERLNTPRFWGWVAGGAVLGLLVGAICRGLTLGGG